MYTDVLRDTEIGRETGVSDEKVKYDDDEMERMQNNKVRGQWDRVKRMTATGYLIYMCVCVYNLLLKLLFKYITHINI